MSDKSNSFILSVESFLRQHFEERLQSLNPRSKRLGDAVIYSLFSGGKRFRPHLIGLLARAMHVQDKDVVPWAAAVECLHTYSLIHDDLPCMDDDDIRRGQPTTHIQFDEATALLAGDALLTEAFLILAFHYKAQPVIVSGLVEILAKSTGLSGMIAGQVEDLSVENSKQNDLTDDELTRIHLLKTGELIKVACVGVAHVAKAMHPKNSLGAIDHIAHFGENLGLAFQLADDLIDHNPKEIEKSSLPAILGVTAAEERLRNVSSLAIAEIRSVLGEAQAQELIELVNLNLNRKI